MATNTRKKFEAIAQIRDYKILGEFVDGYGQEFVVFQVVEGLEIYVTGDDFNWETDWVLENDGNIYKMYYVQKDIKEKLDLVLQKPH